MRLKFIWLTINKLGKSWLDLIMLRLAYVCNVTLVLRNVLTVLVNHLTDDVT